MNNTLIKGLQVVELLAHADRPQPLTHIANRLGMAKSNVHRLLQALTELRYVIRDEATGGYNASIKMWELGSAVLQKLDLRRIAEPRMNTLMEDSGESVHLSVLDHDEVVYVHKIESLNPVRAYTQIGGRVPVYCVATGKAMLAFQSEPFIGRVAERLQRYTDATITVPRRLQLEIDKIRRQGYAVNRGEWRDSVYGVAAPIVDGSGHVIAALGLSGPANRFKPARIKVFSEQVIAAASEISADLGGGSGTQMLGQITHYMIARKR
ncbi:Transcriptional regulator KdgR [Pigmentiphaga humi]|uniref:Transcriptional regulator KdgR n=1 Tax=Pigmentiphaga humi TaxID=2478468 RepID=A0A3P4B5N6_9BURK|nr:IclR family transcriptional regulator [Pigmentiphaga humi]VCU71619.1 Transcriptional regulator KdgR [Pigmentiphaga humi]